MTFVNSCSNSNKNISIGISIKRYNMSPATNMLTIFRFEFKELVRRFDEWLTCISLAKCFLLVINFLLALRASSNLTALVLESASLISDYNGHLLFNDNFELFIVLVNLVLLVNSTLFVLALLLPFKHRSQRRFLEYLSLSQLGLSILTMVLMASLWFCPLHVDLNRQFPDWRDRIQQYSYQFEPDPNGLLPDKSHLMHRSVSFTGQRRRSHYELINQKDSNNNYIINYADEGDDNYDDNHAGRGQDPSLANVYSNLEYKYHSKLDQLQRGLSCCGVSSPDDWAYFNKLGLLPPSCCPQPIGLPYVGHGLRPPRRGAQASSSQTSPSPEGIEQSERRRQQQQQQTKSLFSRLLGFSSLLAAAGETTTSTRGAETNVVDIVDDSTTASLLTQTDEDMDQVPRGVGGEGAPRTAAIDQPNDKQQHQQLEGSNIKKQEEEEEEDQGERIAAPAPGRRRLVDIQPRPSWFVKQIFYCPKTLPAFQQHQQPQHHQQQQQQQTPFIAASDGDSFNLQPSSSSASWWRWSSRQLQQQHQQHQQNHIAATNRAASFNLGCQRVLDEREARFMFNLRLSLLLLVAVLFFNIIIAQAIVSNTRGNGCVTNNGISSGSNNNYANNFGGDLLGMSFVSMGPGRGRARTRRGSCRRTTTTGAYTNATTATSTRTTNAHTGLARSDLSDVGAGAGPQAAPPQPPPPQPELTPATNLPDSSSVHLSVFARPPNTSRLGPTEPTH